MGKKFSTEYQPDEKWTEEKATQLGNELIQWLKKADENMFFEEFLVIEKDLYPEIVTYLKKKFESFFKLIEKAKKIQEIKLYKFGILDKLNAQITKFVLINEHGKKSEILESKNTTSLSVDTQNVLEIINNELNKGKTT